MSGVAPDPAAITDGWVETGMHYCTLHHGVKEQDAYCCDFAADDIDDPEVVTHDGEPRECELQPLMYLVAEHAYGVTTEGEPE